MLYMGQTVIVTCSDFWIWTSSCPQKFWNRQYKFTRTFDDDSSSDREAFKRKRMSYHAYFKEDKQFVTPVLLVYLGL